MITPRTLLISALLAPSLAVVSGCSRDTPGGNNNGMLPGQADAMPAVKPLEAPEVTSWAPETPLPTVAVRGQTQGNRVFAIGAATGTIIANVLPGGAFCIDCTLSNDGEPTVLRLYAVGDGQISEPTVIESLRDPSAPEPGDPTCSGISPTECENAEVCGNGGDDDCNGLEDACDPHCNSCLDDSFEPNDDPVLVPMLDDGSYSGLILCPCRDDWFAFSLDAGEQLHVFADFRQSQVDIDMHLFLAGEDGVGTAGEAVAQAVSSDDDEDLVFTAETAGIYYLRIYSFPSSDGSGNYSLTID